MIVSSIQCINALLGYVSLSLPYTTSPLDALSWLKMSGKICMVVGQGIITATGVALVEELLFRSWLPQEIASDLGYHKGLIISGLAFALLQRFVCHLFLSCRHLPYCMLCTLGCWNIFKKRLISLCRPLLSCMCFPYCILCTLGYWNIFQKGLVYHFVEHFQVGK